jgi:hypothetical protein
MGPHNKPYENPHRIPLPNKEGHYQKVMLDQMEWLNLDGRLSPIEADAYAYLIEKESKSSGVDRTSVRPSDPG